MADPLYYTILAPAGLADTHLRLGVDGWRRWDAKAHAWVSVTHNAVLAYTDRLQNGDGIVPSKPAEVALLV